MGSGMTALVKKALYLIAGGVAARAITQMVLKDKNTGLMGYAGNAVAAVLAGWATSKVLKSKDAGAFVTLGGITAIVQRALTDYTPVGAYINTQMSGIGMRGDLGMAGIVPQTFFVPLQSGADMSTTMPGAIQALAAPRAAGMRGIMTRGGRYTSVGRYS
jgi:hypothetical protein